MANKLQSMKDFTGLTIGPFLVLKLTGHRKYAVRCTTCGTVGEGMGHDTLLKPGLKCFNRGCGKKVFRTWKEEHEHEQQEQINELDSKWKKAVNELAAAEKTLILHAKDEDGFEQSDELRAIRMSSLEEAQRFTVEQIDIFIRDTPDFLPCEHNRRELIGYLERNGIDCFTDAKTLRKAFDRLRQYGLLIERPAPEPEPEPQPAPVQVEPSQPVDDGSEWGYDEKTGEPLRLTRYQVMRLSADEYMRWKKIPFSQLVRPVNPVR
jgi:predicted  nucleic acid-binding Zn-ribbon protein